MVNTLKLFSVAQYTLSNGRGQGEGESKTSQIAIFDSLILTFSRREKGLFAMLNNYNTLIFSFCFCLTQNKGLDFLVGLDRINKRLK